MCLFCFFVCVPKINAQLYFKPVVDCPGELSPVVDFPMTEAQKQVPIICIYRQMYSHSWRLRRHRGVSFEFHCPWGASSSKFSFCCPSTVGRQETGVRAVAHVEEVSRPGHCAAWGRSPTRGKRWWPTPCAPSSLRRRSSPATPRPARQSGALDPGLRWVHGGRGKMRGTWFSLPSLTLCNFAA